jgi:hypothetical protein
MTTTEGVPVAPGGSPHRDHDDDYQPHRKRLAKTEILSGLQSQLLTLAAAGPVRYSAALQKLFGLSRVPGRRGGAVFDASDPKVNTARATLHRSLERLARRGLVQYIPHGYRLVSASNTETSLDVASGSTNATTAR